MARRTAAQRAATARLVATNAARRAGTAIATRTRTIVRRVRSAPRTIVQTVRAPRRARRAALALARGGGAVAIAQARILPGAVGGYLVGKLERDQRAKHAAQVASKSPTGGALIKDPQTRLLAELAVLALAASRTSGIAKEAIVGAAGGVGAIYEMYTGKADAQGNGTNPVDDYLTVVKAGGSGV